MWKMLQNLKKKNPVRATDGRRVIAESSCWNEKRIVARLVFEEENEEGLITGDGAASRSQAARLPFQKKKKQSQVLSFHPQSSNNFSLCLAFPRSLKERQREDEETFRNNPRLLAWNLPRAACFLGGRRFFVAMKITSLPFLFSLFLFCPLFFFSPPPTPLMSRIQKRSACSSLVKQVRQISSPFVLPLAVNSV